MAKDWEAAARAINTRMAELDMTQAELAQKSGVSPATLRKLQRNYEDKSPSRRTLEDVSRALGWSSNHLAQVLAAAERPILNRSAPPSELDELRAEVADLRARVDAIESNQGGGKST